MLPKILKRTISPLKTIIGNMDDVALINILNAKMANMVSQKGVMFQQFSNSKPAILSYFGVNFMNSGSSKDYSINCINDYLLPFVKKDIEDKITDFRQQLEYEQSCAFSKGDKKRLEKEIESVRCPNVELFDPNVQGLYREAEQIKKLNFGALFIRISELGDYLDAIVGGDKAKKELYSKLKDVYNGLVAPSVIAGDNNRMTLENIPVQILMYTDIKNLLNDKIKQYYFNSLKTGFARRSFIYIPEDTTELLAHIQPPEIRNEAINDLVILQKEFKRLFERIQSGKIYKFSQEAQNFIFYEYPNECIDFYNTAKEDIIVKLDKKESYWKIAKLGVIYSILDNPDKEYVDLKHIKMACEFYQKTLKCLKTVLLQRESSEIEKFVKFFVDNKDERTIFSMMELRKTNILPERHFVKIFQELLPEISEELSTYYGYSVYEYRGDKNKKGYQLIKDEQ